MLNWRAWPLALTICLSLWGPIAWSQQGPSQSAEHQHENADKPASQNPEGTPQDKPAATQAPNDNGDSGGKEKAKPDASWTARFVSMFEAHDKFWVAFGTIVIATFTVILGASTVFLWLATRRLVFGAEDTARRQLRAYIFPHELIVTDVELGKQPSANMVVRNTGLTPATEVVAWCGVWLGNFPLVTELVRATPDFMRTASRRSVGPGGSFTINHACNAPLTAQHIQMLQNGTAAIFVWGEITYLDAFGQERRTGFRSYYGGNTGMRPDGATVTHQEGNESD